MGSRSTALTLSQADAAKMPRPPNRGAGGICAGTHVAPAIVSGIVSLRGEVIRTREHEGVWLHCPTGGDYVGEPGQQLDHHGDGTRTHRVFGHRPAESELSRVYWNLWARRPRLARCKSVVARGEQRLAATGDSVVRYSGPTGLAQEFRPVLEVHRVVVRPSAAPDETVLLEHPDNFQWDMVHVTREAIGRSVPEPIVRLG
jgi:hypothetical protein